LRHSILLLLVLFVSWLVLSGHYTPLLIGLGVLSCFLVLWLCRRMDIIDKESVFFHVVPGLIMYIPWLFLEIVKSNLDVARRILSPSLPISPTVVVVPAPQESELKRVIYANSITLTPGTLAMRVRGNAILVHALSEDAAKTLEEGEMGRRVTNLSRDP